METDLEPLQEGGRVYKSSFVGGTVTMTDTHEFAIYFEDLTEKAQRSLLIYAGIPDPAYMNWDVFPVATISLDEEDK